jgi:hypothetical protein
VVGAVKMRKGEDSKLGPARVTMVTRAVSRFKFTDLRSTATSEANTIQRRRQNGRKGRWGNTEGVSI